MFRLVLPHLPWHRLKIPKDRLPTKKKVSFSYPIVGVSAPIPTVGELVQVAHYFRGAMEQRRSIGLRAFFAVTGFDLLIVKGVLDYQALRTPGGLWLTRIGVLVGLAVYLCLVVNIERVNWRGQESYKTVEQLLRERLGDANPRRGFCKQETGWAAMRGSWSGLWPALAAVGLGLACFLFLLTL